MEGASAKNQNNASECIAKVLECSVCYLRMEHPKMLPCQHTYCLSCLGKIANHDLKKISCAICRSQHNLPIGGVIEFPNNLTLASLIDSISDSTTSVVKGPLTRVLIPQITSETSTSTVTVFFRGSILPFLQTLIFQSFALFKSNFLINFKYMQLF